MVRQRPARSGRGDGESGVIHPLYPAAPGSRKSLAATKSDSRPARRAMFRRSACDRDARWRAQQRRNQDQPEKRRQRADARAPATIKPRAPSSKVGGDHAHRGLDRLADPMCRSSSRGKETTLIASASTANRKPTPTPTTIISQPAPVSKVSRTNAPADAGASVRASGRRPIGRGQPQQHQRHQDQAQPNIEPSAGDRKTPKASASRPSGRLPAPADLIEASAATGR